MEKELIELSKKIEKLESELITLKISQENYRIKKIEEYIISSNEKADFLKAAYKYKNIIIISLIISYFFGLTIHDLGAIKAIINLETFL
jgi:hypothetical protein